MVEMEDDNDIAETNFFALRIWSLLFYVGDAGNTSLVDAGTPLGATVVVTPGSAGYLLWECCILASLQCGMATSGTCSPQLKAVREASAQCNNVALGTTKVMLWCHVSDVIILINRPAAHDNI